MRIPRLFAAGLWLGVTLTSTAMVWAATSIVAADVTDRPPPVVAHAEVVSELASASAPLAITPTTAAPRADSPTSTSTTPDRTSVPSGSGPRVSTTTLPRPAATVAPSPPTTPTTPTTPTPTTVVGLVPVFRPPAPNTAQPSRPTATYSTSGGVVRVSCNGFLITLISAIPNNGYAANVAVNGPVNVDVHFVRAGQDVSVKAVCLGQPIRYYDQAPARGSPF